MSVQIDGHSYSWTQPQCDLCWLEAHDDRLERTPYRFAVPDQEQCAFCGTLTESGIYVRIDPRTVPHPTFEDEDA